MSSIIFNSLINKEAGKTLQQFKKKTEGTTHLYSDIDYKNEFTNRAKLVISTK